MKLGKTEIERSESYKQLAIALTLGDGVSLSNHYKMF